MKLALLAPLPPPVGGIATWATNYIESLKDTSWSAVGVDEKDENRQVYSGNKKKFNFFAQAKRCLRIWSSLWRVLDDPDVRIVHINIPTNILSTGREIVSVAITKLRGRKVIIHFHCTVSSAIKSRAQYVVMKVLCAFAGNTIALNEKSQKYLQKHTNANVFLIPNFVPDSMLEKKGATIRDTVKTALYVGGIIELKGCQNIIDIAKRVPEIQFRMVGYVSEQFQNIIMPDNVIMTGVKTGRELENEFVNSDFFIFLSHMPTEGFSIALTEAMAHGLPCIATDWAANKDMIEDKGGYIIPTFNVEAGVSAVKEMINQPKTSREEMSEFNFNKVKNCYAGSKITRELVQVYEEIL